MGAAVQPAGVRFVREAGYDGCVELSNASTRVVLEPNVGGRVLRFALHGAEALHAEPAQDGVLWDGRGNLRHPAGGRFDFGPEYGGVPHEETWYGRWTAEITAMRAARLISATLPDSGLQVVREFRLHEDPRLECTQVIHNRGLAPIAVFHWSRTFLAGGGTAFAPLPQFSRFPRGYAVGGPAGVLNFLPQADPNVRIREGLLEVRALPLGAKLALDVEPGWLGYVNASGLLFLKTFAVHSHRRYGELAANNASIWYGGKANTPTWPLTGDVAEIEAIGPAEVIAPGSSCMFTEDWFLLQVARGEVNAGWLKLVAGQCTPSP